MARVTDERSNTDSARGRRWTLVVALVFAALGFGFLVTVLLWQPTAGSVWQRVAYQLLSQAWLLLVLAAFVLVGYEFFLHRRLVDEFARISGPRIVEALLPQQVMETFLASIYGANDANRDVVAGVLGGEGIRPHGGDLTISAHTTVDFELQAVDRDTYHMTLTLSYSFRKNVAEDRFIIFATCDALLRDSISSGCRLPLFDLWFVPDASLFQSSVDDMLPSVRIHMSYLDQDGRRREAEASRIRLKEVKFERWPDYLTFFRESMGPLPRQNARNHLHDLRIFECDLSGVADEDHVVSSIERLTLRSTTRQRIDDRYCYWQSPYPCYVERISIDAKGLDLGGSMSWEFRVVPFMFRSNTASARWLSAENLGDLDVRSWLLPGHGVALLWRASDEADPARGLGT